MQKWSSVLCWTIWNGHFCMFVYTRPRVWHPGGCHLLNVLLSSLMILICIGVSLIYSCTIIPGFLWYFRFHVIFFSIKKIYKMPKENDFLNVHKLHIKNSQIRRKILQFCNYMFALEIVVVLYSLLFGNEFYTTYIIPYMCICLGPNLNHVIFPYIFYNLVLQRNTLIVNNWKGDFKCHSN